MIYHNMGLLLQALVGLHNLTPNGLVAGVLLDTVTSITAKCQGLVACNTAKPIVDALRSQAHTVCISKMVHA